MMGLIGTMVAAALSVAPLYAERATDAEGVLLRESFESPVGPFLPEGWSSSHTRSLLWPDFVVSGDASGRGDRAALAESVIGDAWLMSPPIAPGACAGIEVRCRVRVSHADDASVHLEVSVSDAPAHRVATGLPVENGVCTEHRIPIDVRSWSGASVALRWHVRTDPRSRPLAVKVDDVVVVGLNDREWADRETGQSEALSPGQIVVNEIMYAPRSGEPEWVELLNAGESPVNVGGWTISDASGARSNPFAPIVVPAGATVVVTRDLLQFTLVRGELQCEAAAPGGFPSLNNGGDIIIVRTGAGAAIDSVSYLPSWGGAAGRSLERRNPRSPPEAKNWGECADSAGATPCAVNSIAVLAVDVELSLRPGYRIPYGTAVSIDAVLENAGLEPVQDIEVRWFIDEDHDAVPDGNEEIAFRRESGPLRPGDSVAVSAEWTGARPGIHHLIVRADVIGDGRPENNLALAALVVGQPPGSVAINEIMYQPLSGESEYVELTAVDGTLAIDGWSLQLGLRHDGKPEKSIELKGMGGGDGEEDRIVEFAVIASDSSILSRFGRLRDSTGAAWLLIARSALGLGNSGELIRLVDPSGGTVDSVSYDPDWHDPAFTDVSGRSLEKIHPRLDGTARQSWSTSVAPDGGTPGMQNSVVAPVERHGSALHALPNPFSPDGDGREDHAVVSYRLEADAGYTIIRVFDVTGRLIRTLMERERGGREGETVWDGRDDLSRRVRIGMYILHLEAFDGSGTMVGSARTVVAVAGRL